MTFARARRAPWPPGERGSVTLETAFAIVVLLAVLVVALWSIGVGVSVLRAQDAARNAARSIARGETYAQARQLAQQIAPSASLTFAVQGNAVTATVRQRVRGNLPLLDRIGITVERSAVAARETP